MSPNPTATPRSRDEIARVLDRTIAHLDRIISRQVNAILHHPRFQRLEASWRGLRYLVDQVEEGANVKVRVLNVSWRDLTRDVERAMEFDQSQLFRKVYNDEFGMPGGEPYSILLGDYEVRPRPAPDHPHDDVAALAALSHVAAAAFAPFVTAAHPALFALDHFTELELPLNLGHTFDQPEYLKWRALRNSEDSRFLGVTLPRVLMRQPYRDDGSRADGFRFREDVTKPDRSEYLWGTAVYALGAVVVRAFMESGWPAGIRGATRGREEGGLVTGLPTHPFQTDKEGVAPRPITDGVVGDVLEKELGELGFLPLCHCQYTGLAVFHTSPSVQKPKRYDEAGATINARLSAMLHYMLAVSRFAHYLKVLGRDRTGSFAGPGECEDFLNRWLMTYTTADDNLDQELKARYPLRESHVQVRERPGKPGAYFCVIHLRPHFQLDEVAASVRLTTEMAPGQPG